MDFNKLLSGLTSSGVLGGVAGGAAAAAGGHLDSAERQRIMARLKQLELAPPGKTLVMDVLQQPPSQAAVCAQVNCPEVATEVYLSLLLAVDAECAQAALYLDTLAHRLNLPAGLVTQLKLAAEAESAGATRSVA
jgi:uncharacterized membrane protein YebE (DUF533 family)